MNDNIAESKYVEEKHIEVNQTFQDPYMTEIYKCYKKVYKEREYELFYTLLNMMYRYTLSKYYPNEPLKEITIVSTERAFMMLEFAQLYTTYDLNNIKYYIYNLYMQIHTLPLKSSALLHEYIQINHDIYNTIIENTEKNCQALLMELIEYSTGNRSKLLNYDNVNIAEIDLTEDVEEDLVLTFS